MVTFDEFICFRIGALSRRIYRHYNKEFARFGITVGQSFILLDLLANASSNVKEIAGRLQLDSPAITGFVDRLAKEGLLERNDDPADRRSLRICLTDNGLELARTLVPLAQQFNERIKAVIASEDLAAFERGLEVLENTLE